MVLLFALALLVAACSSSEVPQPTKIPEPAFTDPFAVGKPLEHPGIGDVDAAFARYEATRSDLIDKFKAQAWFQDGLTRDESLFVERSVTFVARYSGPRVAYISDATIADKLYYYKKLQLSQGELELMLIYEPAQEAAATEMSILEAVVPQLEAVVGVPYPEKVMTVINGTFGINDFNDGQFVRIDRCCVSNPFILAHELSHTYWSVGPAWFNEGMADLYAVLVLQRLDANPSPGWQPSGADMDSYIAGRRRIAARNPQIAIPQRLASQGLYEGADVLLYDVRQAIGADAFLAGARDIYLASDYGRTSVSEGRIESIFLDHASSSAVAAVKQLFNQNIWGDNGEAFQQYQEQLASP